MTPRKELKRISYIVLEAIKNANWDMETAGEILITKGDDILFKYLTVEPNLTIDPMQETKRALLQLVKSHRETTIRDFQKIRDIPTTPMIQELAKFSESMDDLITWIQLIDSKSMICYLLKIRQVMDKENETTWMFNQIMSLLPIAMEISGTAGMPKPRDFNDVLEFVEDEMRRERLKLNLNL